MTSTSGPASQAMRKSNVVFLVSFPYAAKKNSITTAVQQTKAVASDDAEPYSPETTSCFVKRFCDAVGNNTRGFSAFVVYFV